MLHLRHEIRQADGSHHRQAFHARKAYGVRLLAAMTNSSLINGTFDPENSHDIGGQGLILNVISALSIV
jgi:imidazoleglycerol phosphate synthase glutamine amidotransferase subunit HisH